MTTGDRHRLDRVGLISVLCSLGIFTTTIQAQDFKDVEGDARIGRRTLALICPEIARPTLFLALLAWTTSLSTLWKLDVWSTLLFHVLAVIVGGRFMIFKGIKADQKNYLIYNVSVSGFFF